MEDRVVNTEPRLASQHTLAVLLVRATSDTDAGVPRSTSMMITWVAVASLACLIILAGAQGQAPLLRLDQPKPKCDGLHPRAGQQTRCLPSARTQNSARNVGTGRRVTGRRGIQHPHHPGIGLGLHPVAQGPA